MQIRQSVGLAPVTVSTVCDGTSINTASLNANRLPVVRAHLPGEPAKQTPVARMHRDFQSVEALLAVMYSPAALLQAVPIRPVSIVALCLAPQEGYDHSLTRHT